MIGVFHQLHSGAGEKASTVPAFSAVKQFKGIVRPHCHPRDRGDDSGGGGDCGAQWKTDSGLGLHLGLLEKSVFMEWEDTKKIDTADDSEYYPFRTHKDNRIKRIKMITFDKKDNSKLGIKWLL